MDFYICEKEVDLENDVKIKFKPLEIVDYQKVLSILRNVNEKEADEEKGMAIAKNEELPSVLETILPKYVSKIEGVHVFVSKDIKESATIGQIAKYGCFFNLALSILTTIFSNSSVSEGQSKDVKKP